MFLLQPDIKMQNIDYNSFQESKPFTKNDAAYFGKVGAEMGSIGGLSNSLSGGLMTQYPSKSTVLQQQALGQQQYQPYQPLAQWPSSSQALKINDETFAAVKQEIEKRNKQISEASDRAKQLKLIVKQKEKKKMFGFAKEYMERHKDTVMTVVFVLIVDYFFLGGALRHKIKSIAENALDTAQKKLNNPPNVGVLGGPKDAA